MSGNTLPRDDEHAPRAVIAPADNPVELELIALHELTTHPTVIGVELAFLGAKALTEVALESIAAEDEKIVTNA
jgi:hypothetical protein